MHALKRYFFLGLFLCCSSFLFGQNHTNFNHISPILNNKLAWVSKTVQDPLGNIWILCGNGVLIYDGYNYKLIKNKTIFNEWKENDRIDNIITDYKKNIWVLTKSGLVSKYDIKNNSFENITALIKEPISKMCAKSNGVWLISNNSILYNYSNSEIKKIGSVFNQDAPLKSIMDIDLVTPNELFLSTINGKVYNYSLESKTLNEIIGPFTDYPGNLIFTTDKNNRLWIGTETYGLFVYDPINKEFIQDRLFSKERFNINKEMFLSLFCDSNGNIWGGTDGGGLYKINSKNGKIDLFTKHDSNEFSLGSNTILDISEDNHKNIWVSTNYGKLNVLPFKNNNIGYHSGSASKTPQRILTVFKSSKNVLWLGTDGSGLTKVTNDKNSTFIKETQYFNNIALNKGFYVQSIAEDSKSNIWIGTYKNGLHFHNTNNNTFKKIDIINSKKQEATDIRTLFNDSEGRIWVGSNISINVYSKNLELLASFENNKHGLEGSILESIVEDKNGIIWLGIYQGGFFKLNENIDNFKNSTFIKQSYFNDNNHDEVSSVKYMSVGKGNELWLINSNGELLKFDTINKTYSTFEHIESINAVNIAAVIVDGNNLWLSSSNGVVCLDIENSVAKTYYSIDGLQDDVFLSRSAFKDKQGVLYFGGIKGVNYFNPKGLKKKESYAKLYINDIEILNQPIDSLIPSAINTGTYNIESLKLKNNQSSFSFRFSAIDNILNPKYYYAYRLKGFDKDWITSHSERMATYTNIPAGKYTFEVKAGSKQNSWDIPAKRINIEIEQPLWNKPIAYILYFFIIILLVYGMKRWYLLRKKLFLEKVSHKKENEIHEAKMNFFAKMSHEIQTPITLILGPLNDMLTRSEQNGNLLLKQRLNIIFNNAQRLSKIAKELTLVRNKELNTLKLFVTKNSLCNDIESISLSFKELARNKKIDFVINCPNSMNYTWYDKEKVEHILYNLLSNAFKFTPKNGFIQLNVVPTNSKKRVKISVTDSGPGIPKKELNDIFELFYQSNIGKKNKGSGIGLNLTKELVDLHKGKIQVDSIQNEGTTFTVNIPITENAYHESERITTSNFEESNIITHTDNNDNLLENDNINISKKTILIVEDNYNLQAFLKELLINQYNILLSENGEEGYHYAKTYYPDLILSDIMMPKVDGIEMCHKLQGNQLTKHIPVILLTAKNSTNSKIDGLKSGAIEYINKPFNTNELLLKVKNIIQSKEHIISKYRKEIISRPNVGVEKSQDELFLENLVAEINLRLDQANFKMEELADSLNMSYSALYRKCQSLTGHSLVDYVRIIRLKKAAVFITQHGYSISETAFMTGFNDPKYFSKCFKRYFKKTPKDFKKSTAITDNLEEYLSRIQ
ncbi:two-component regulator propeller domain-containing protein [Wocania ichthyoenteri]|uniref:hybrid sensor histidine kinase/response regulator transcription factor n=1 Tax=Wocania ichthyoenteri TaxID=1230531 RepID=UPI0009E01045|nr:two-component regulator propeller domain-containing protein [Wocania ichthyoenteri]